MFAMYDDDGLNFRSTIDHLYDIHEISPTQRIKKDFQMYKGNIDEEAKRKYKQIANLHKKSEIFHVEQIMTRNPIIISDNSTLEYAYQLMLRNSIRQLLVRPEGKNTLKGMITKNMLLDYLMKHTGEEDIKQTLVRDVGENKIITTDPITDVRRAAKVMIDFNRNAIPVVSADHDILGVVTRHDIVKAVSSIPELQIWA